MDDLPSKPILPRKKKRQKPLRMLSPFQSKGWKRAFLEAICNCSTIREACAIVKRTSTHVYRSRKDDPLFAKEWEIAYNNYARLQLEAEAYHRADKGSDKLLMYILSRRYPEVWGEDVSEVKLQDVHFTITRRSDEAPRDPEETDETPPV